MKLTPTQDKAIRLAIYRGRLVRYEGGYWSRDKLERAAPGRPYAASQKALDEFGWVQIQTVRSLEKRGLLQMDPRGIEPLWKRPRLLTEEGRRYAQTLVEAEQS